MLNQFTRAFARTTSTTLRSLSQLKFSSAAPAVATKTIEMHKELDTSYFELPAHTPFCDLDCKKAFDNLTPKERLYSHHIAQASWNGSLVVLLQTSPESPYLFVFLHKLFRAKPLAELKSIACNQCGFSNNDFTGFLVYAAGVFANSGNYRGFGDTKIVPGISQEKVNALVGKLGNNDLTALWNQIQTKMFSLGDKERRLGLSDKGVTGYHSFNVTAEDSKLVEKYMKSKGLEMWNTRLFKTTDKGKASFEIRTASLETGAPSEVEEFEGALFRRTTGDYSHLFKPLVKHLSLAKKHAANEHQASMMDCYVKHFTTGALEDHKNASRHWIKDKGPTVESYIGFIENYRDPMGARSEFEGFVAAVDKEMSKKFGALVDNAGKLLPRLPWDTAYEKDEFLKPDFTSLDVVCFGSSGIPAGINIPNYDEIRQSEGFKNVSLGNVIAAFPNVKINFVSDEDAGLIKKYHREAFEVQVGLHELLGHGSGKLFQKNEDGTFNFDKAKVKDMETGGEITKWYEPGETWSTKYGYLGSAYEECRAEAVGYCLCCFEDVLKIFGYEGEDAQTIKYVNWLSELRAGLLGLEFFSPESGKWGQAHCHARYVLLRVAMEPNDGFVSIEKVIDPEDGKPDLKFRVDCAKIQDSGFKYTMAFLKLLQLYKSTGDFEKGKALFDKYSDISPAILEWRDIVIARRQPRRLFVQPNTVLSDSGEDVVLKTYPADAEGAITSNVERYPDDTVFDHLVKLADADKHHFAGY